MRSIMLIALTTTIACETTEVDTAENSEDTQAEIEEKASSDMDIHVVNEDLAGGIPNEFGGLTYYEDSDPADNDNQDLWVKAPLTAGNYQGVIEEVYEAQCNPLKPGDAFEASIVFKPQGHSVLNGGLLESNGDTLRYRRVKEAPYLGDEDCLAVEVTRGNGMVDGNMAMAMDMEITMELEGATCPVIDPCIDSYSAYLEHQMIDVETPNGPELEVDFDFEFDDLQLP